MPTPPGLVLPAEAATRMVADLLAEELQRLRPGGPPSSARGWTRATALTGDGDGAIGADSLELLELATAVSVAFNLPDVGIEDYLLARRTLGQWGEIVQAGLERGRGRLTFRTSGSTGAPKPCTHDARDLLRETAALAAILDGRTRVLAAVPCHHIYGFLFTVLLPDALGIPVLDLRGHPPASLARIARAGDLVVAHPAWWALVPPAAALPAGVWGTTSTAPCPAPVAHGLAEAGLERLVEVYGSTETAGIGWRDRPDAPFTLFAHWTAEGAEGAEGAERRDLRRPSADGGVRRHSLPDHAAWLDDRRFRILGRRDGAVQVAGVNVFPDRVAAALAEHPDVAAAAVRLMRPDEGARLKAFVVPRDPAADPADLRARLAAWAERTLKPPERPKAFTLGPSVPAGPMGKPADWPIG